MPGPLRFSHIPLSLPVRFSSFLAGEARGGRHFKCSSPPPAPPAPLTSPFPYRELASFLCGCSLLLGVRPCTSLSHARFALAGAVANALAHGDSSSTCDVKDTHVVSQRGSPSTPRFARGSLSNISLGTGMGAPSFARSGVVEALAFAYSVRLGSPARPPVAKPHPHLSKTGGGRVRDVEWRGGEGGRLEGCRVAGNQYGEAEVGEGSPGICGGFS